MASPKQILPYSLWPSPLTPALLGGSARLDEVAWAADGTLVWLEGRSGQGTLVAQPPGGSPRDLTAGQNVRGGILYGGGEFHAGQEWLVFAEKDGRLYRRPLHVPGLPVPITPPFGRAAAPRLSPDERWVIYVHSDGTRDCLALVPADGSAWPVQLARGADFYMQPVWSSDGAWLAWVEWDHPNMPWDGARLMLTRFDPARPALADVRQLAGGPDLPVFQPEFSPDGRWLSWVAGDGEWDSLWLLDLSGGEPRRLLHERPLLAEAWVQGIRTYAWSGDSRHIVWIENRAGFSSLWRLDLADEQPHQLPAGPYTWIRQVAVCPRTGRLAFLGASTGIPDQVVVWDGGRLITARASQADLLDPAEFADPQPLEWRAPDGAAVYGLFFPPASTRFAGEGLPPVIVHAHGGPTTLDRAEYEERRAYFTHRGFGWLSVNYRGSSGYGRAYLRALDGKWGELDVVDTIAGAQALLDHGLADPNRLVVEGSSAGGFTVLNALARAPGLFRAGMAAYPVTDLFRIAQVTFKFEQRYLDRLIGPLPEAAAIYRERSPLSRAASIRDPLALFQGDQDEAVPAEQAEQLVAALRASGVPHVYHLFPGEGHGFRKAENVAAYFREMDSFLRERVLFA